ncbi:helix-turn-helix transcriptional regulator [Streptomyces tendae]|uniref:helix-turn-helix transcriptional regulator n=1 Tax=Streptomyces tendae TaxID=1932 RepID=UPI00369E4896
MEKNELGPFLRTRRGRMSPADVGLPSHGRRRVPGLRREEVAILAGVSTDYYTKLEQGHATGVSDAVLHAIADVLALDSTERAHLRRLAHPAAGGRGPGPRRTLAPVREGLRRLLDMLTDVPAVIVGPSFNALAWNNLADALFDIEAAEESGLHYARQMFLDPAARTFYPQWEHVATEVVGYLRYNAGHDPDNQELNALIGELSVKSPEFRTLWGRQTVRDKTHGRKLIHHPSVGDLTLAFETFRLAEDTRQALITYTADAGSPSEERLRLLASWSAPSRERTGGSPGAVREDDGSSADSPSDHAARDGGP